MLLSLASGNGVTIAPAGDKITVTHQAPLSLLTGGRPSRLPFQAAIPESGRTHRRGGPESPAKARLFTKRRANGFIPLECVALCWAARAFWNHQGRHRRRGATPSGRDSGRAAFYYGAARHLTRDAADTNAGRYRGAPDLQGFKCAGIARAARTRAPASPRAIRRRRSFGHRLCADLCRLENDEQWGRWRRMWRRWRRRMRRVQLNGTPRQDEGDTCKCGVNRR
jgi:hypothetical protein